MASLANKTSFHFDRMSDNWTEKSPAGMAFQMAARCKDVSKIYAYVTNYFGRPGVVSKDTIERAIRAHAGRTMRNVAEPLESDAADFTPNRQIRIAPAPKPVVAAEPEQDHPAFEARRPDQYFRVTALIAYVAAAFKMTPEELTGRSRAMRFVDARAVVIAVLRERGWSYPKIANVIGRRDHSTVIHCHGMWDIYVKRNPMITKVHAACAPFQKMARRI